MIRRRVRRATMPILESAGSRGLIRKPTVFVADRSGEIPPELESRFLDGTRLEYAAIRFVA
jgi:hypothetical protein